MGKKVPASVSQGTPKKKARTDSFGVSSVVEMGQLAAAAGSIPRPRFDGGCALLYSESWDDNELALFSFAYDAQPNPLFYFSKVLELHGASAKESQSPAPMTREEIQERGLGCTATNVSASHSCPHV